MHIQRFGQHQHKYNCLTLNNETEDGSNILGFFYLAMKISGTYIRIREGKRERQISKRKKNKGQLIYLFSKAMHTKDNGEINPTQWRASTLGTRVPIHYKYDPFNRYHFFQQRLKLQTHTKVTSSLNQDHGESKVL